MPLPIVPAPITPTVLIIVTCDDHDRHEDTKDTKVTKKNT